MEKPSVRSFLLRPLAHRLQAWARFVSLQVGEEVYAVRREREHREDAVTGDGSAALLESPPAVEIEEMREDVPPAHWLERVDREGPPAAWLARVRQDAPDLLQQRGPTRVGGVLPRSARSADASPLTGTAPPVSQRESPQVEAAVFASADGRQAEAPAQEARENGTGLSAGDAVLLSNTKRGRDEPEAQNERGGPEVGRQYGARAEVVSREKAAGSPPPQAAAPLSGRQQTAPLSPTPHRGDEEGFSRQDAPAFSSWPEVAPPSPPLTEERWGSAIGAGHERVESVPSVEPMQLDRSTQMKRTAREERPVGRSAQPAVSDLSAALPVSAVAQTRQVDESRPTEIHWSAFSGPEALKRTGEQGPAEDRWSSLSEPEVHKQSSESRSIEDRWPLLPESDTVKQMRELEQTEREGRWPSLPATARTEIWDWEIAQRAWERQQRLDREQRGSAWNV